MAHYLVDNISPLMLRDVTFLLPPLSLSFLPRSQQFNEMRSVVLIFFIVLTCINNIGLEYDADGHFASLHKHWNVYGSE